MSEFSDRLAAQLEREARSMKMAADTMDQRTKGAKDYNRRAILMALAATYVRESQPPATEPKEPPPRCAHRWLPPDAGGRSLCVWCHDQRTTR